MKIAQKCKKRDEISNPSEEKAFIPDTSKPDVCGKHQNLSITFKEKKILKNLVLYTTQPILDNYTVPDCVEQLPAARLMIILRSTQHNTWRICL